MDCGPRMQYTECANCPVTCSNTEAMPCLQQTCVEGCECLPGLVISGNECIEPSQCGCQDEGKYYTVIVFLESKDCIIKYFLVFSPNIFLGNLVLNPVLFSTH